MNGSNKSNGVKKGVIFAIVVAACAASLALLSGCATERPKELKATCNESPSFVTVDHAGRRIGIYVCFGEENRLLYSPRVLPPEPTTAPSPSSQTIPQPPAAALPNVAALKKVCATKTKDLDANGRALKAWLCRK